MADYSLRAAQADEAGAIRSLVLSSGINPTGLDWRRFVVAVAADGKLLGCGQLKPHGADVLELASIAVVPAQRKQGIASAVITVLLQDAPRPLYLMCRSPLGPFYERFGFRAVGENDMPAYFRRLSRLAGLVESLARSGESLLVMKLQ